MTLSISEKYLEALNANEGWMTVSEWAKKVGDMFPEVLESANRDAEGQKNETTGLREIAARISSNISRGAYTGKIEIDESERPRRAKYISEKEAHDLEEKEKEDDLAPLSRADRIARDEALLSTRERYRVAEMVTIISQMKEFFSITYELDHSKAILNHLEPGKHHPDNMQILTKAHNASKNNDNWERFNLDEQIEYIRATVRVQKLVSKKMEIEMDEEVIEQVISRLKLVY
jgi:hypothetical protein